MKRTSQQSTISSFFNKRPRKTTTEPGGSRASDLELDSETDHANSGLTNVSTVNTEALCEDREVNISTSVTVTNSSYTSTLVTVSASATSTFADSSQLPHDISLSKDNELVQPKRKVFPKKAMFGKMRSFQSSWYEAFPFIEYSEERDALYCFCCRHFPLSSRKVEDSFTRGVSY